LEGSVRRSGNRIRVTAQLINAVDGYHLWSDNFDRELGDVFAIQEEIARAITDSLKVRLHANESKQLASVPTENFEAYDFYLLGQFYREKRNPADLDKSIDLFQQALDLDDRFAPAYSALAASYLYQAYYDDLPSEKVQALTDPLLDRCLELDPLSAEAHATRSSVRLLLSDFAAAEEGYGKALEMKPNYAGAWSNLGFALVRQSHLKEAATAYSRSEALDPLNSTLKFNIGALRMLTGHYSDGLQSFKTVLQIAPDRTRTENAIAYWSISYGRFEEAARWSKRAAEREPESPGTFSLLSRLYGSLGMWDQSLDAALRAYELAPERVLYLSGVAYHYFLVGDHARLASFVDDEYSKIDPLAPAGSSPMNRIRYFWHGFLALLEGDYLQAVADLTDAAGGEEGIADAVYDEISTLKHLALALRRQGRDEEADALLEQCLGLSREALEQGWATPAIFYRIAQIHALRGDAVSAVQYLREAVDKGWRAAADLEMDPLWSNMQDDADFQNIIMEVNDDIRQQRQKVAQLLGNHLP
jgi:tetratricopeptide (TPR) repeat protein